MSKTKELTIVCSGEIRVSASRNKSTIHIEDPEMDELLKEIPWENVVEFVRGEKVSPDEVFTDEQLEKWAEENGYTKE